MIIQMQNVINSGYHEQLSKAEHTVIDIINSMQSKTIILTHNIEITVIIRNKELREQSGSLLPQCDPLISCG